MYARPSRGSSARDEGRKNFTEMANEQIRQEGQVFLASRGLKTSNYSSSFKIAIALANANHNDKLTMTPLATDSDFNRKSVTFTPAFANLNSNQEPAKQSGVRVSSPRPKPPPSLLEVMSQPPLQKSDPENIDVNALLLGKTTMENAQTGYEMTWLLERTLPNPNVYPEGTLDRQLKEYPLPVFSPYEGRQLEQKLRYQEIILSEESPLFIKIKAMYYRIHLIDDPYCRFDLIAKAKAMCRKLRYYVIGKDAIQLWTIEDLIDELSPRFGNTKDDYGCDGPSQYLIGMMPRWMQNNQERWKRDTGWYKDVEFMKSFGIETSQRVLKGEGPPKTTRQMIAEIDKETLTTEQILKIKHEVGDPDNLYDIPMREASDNGGSDELDGYAPNGDMDDEGSDLEEISGDEFRSREQSKQRDDSSDLEIVESNFHQATPTQADSEAGEEYEEEGYSENGVQMRMSSVEEQYGDDEDEDMEEGTDAEKSAADSDDIEILEEVQYGNAIIIMDAEGDYEEEGEEEEEEEGAEGQSNSDEDEEEKNDEDDGRDTSPSHAQPGRKGRKGIGGKYIRGKHVGSKYVEGTSVRGISSGGISIGGKSVASSSVGNKPVGGKSPSAFPELEEVEHDSEGNEIIEDGSVGGSYEREDEEGLYDEDDEDTETEEHYIVSRTSELVVLDDSGDEATEAPSDSQPRGQTEQEEEEASSLFGDEHMDDDSHEKEAKGEHRG